MLGNIEQNYDVARVIEFRLPGTNIEVLMATAEIRRADIQVRRAGTEVSPYTSFLCIARSIFRI